ncbi:hypothetical protein C8034_v011447 [Colletotrichum sidae]|uniref:Uncharacterized protein n=2 Tax=Colletotrichum orbiculare species complex TaxID=2707354 RepID=N4VFI3_COLOR|nr:hypothetical protein Cob_v007671 [Colletotrichum orbiculare MAFF 240422]TEA18267.1 hypothetical protein C8034_v011447 [Colletotrichum sidae]
MSRYFPHTSYAEDQPLFRTILTVHVLARGYTTGAVVGLGAVSVATAYNFIRGVKPADTLRRALRTTGTASVVGTGLMGLALAGRMWGREEIEWRDRSWRLLENPGQVEVDDWTAGGVAAGLAAATGVRGGGWRAGAGAVGIGSVAGTLGYMVWRYGVHAGKFPVYVGVDEVEL